jgi:transcription elongation factor Elf1
MKFEQLVYLTNCPVCDSECIVECINVDEAPVYCAMCGTEAEISEISSDE